MSEELEQDVAVVGEPTDDSAEVRQPQEQGKDQGLDFSKLNLDDVPQFRAWKSARDKEAEAARQALIQSNQRLSAIEQQFHEAQMAGMDAQQRLEYQNRLLQQEIQNERQLRQVMEFDVMRKRDILAVAKRKGLDPDELESALPKGADSFVLWETAESLSEQKGKSKQAPQAKTQPVREVDNTVDLGGAPSGTATNKYQEMYDKAVKNGSVLDMIDAMAAAGRAGVALRE